VSYVIFARDRGRDGKRLMHAAREGAGATLCDHSIGRGSGLVRDGDYNRSTPCRRCWEINNQPEKAS
jgi:hypothetical protein